jgi:hypothetical protein
LTSTLNLSVSTCFEGLGSLSTSDEETDFEIGLEAISPFDIFLQLLFLMPNPFQS